MEENIKLRRTRAKNAILVNELSTEPKPKEPTDFKNIYSKGVEYQHTATKQKSMILGDNERSAMLRSMSAIPR